MSSSTLPGPTYACVGRAGPGSLSAERQMRRPAPSRKKVGQRGGPQLSGPARAGPQHMCRPPLCRSQLLDQDGNAQRSRRSATHMSPARPAAAGPALVKARVQEQGPARRGHKRPGAHERAHARTQQASESPETEIPLGKATTRACRERGNMRSRNKSRQTPPPCSPHQAAVTQHAAHQSRASSQTRSRP